VSISIAHYYNAHYKKIIEQKTFASSGIPTRISSVNSCYATTGGDHHNHYMWYGGNNMARWTGSSITNQYAAGVNMYSDLLPNEPKSTHLTRLHKLIVENSAILLGSNIQIHNPVHLLYYNNKLKLKGLRMEHNK